MISVRKTIRLPRSLKSQYDEIYHAISHADIFFKETVSIIALYALSVGFKTDFQRRFITYSAGTDGGTLTVATYRAGAPDYRYALLDFSFCGRCRIRFRIHQKGDEMWFGIVGDQRVLNEKTLWKRGGRGRIWSYYCGINDSRYERTVDDKFEPEQDCPGVKWGKFGSLHLPSVVAGKLLPSNTGDFVDLEVDAQNKTFKVFVNGAKQASIIARGMPDQLSFWLELDYTADKVEFELLDFSFKKRRIHVGRQNARRRKR